MANHLDLEEQEQLDQLKHFWKQYGNPISLLLIVVLGGFAAWNGYQWWSQRQASQASAMYEEVDQVIASGDIGAAERAYTEMQKRFPSTAYTQQAGLALAKVAYLSGKSDIAQSALASVSQAGSDTGLSALAGLRHAGLLIESGKFDQATKILDGKFPIEFTGLVSDKKGDAALAQGNKDAAIAMYQDAIKQLQERDQYRRLVEVKLASLGASEAK